MIGKVVVITGGAGGIGHVTANYLSELGADVILTDKTKGLDNKKILIADASKEEEIKLVVDQTVEKYGKIDVLFNNCGVGANLDYTEKQAIVLQTAEDIKTENLHRVMSINFENYVWFVKHVIPHMPKTEESSIISSSSIWAKGKLFHALPYTANKAALSAVLMSWAYQYAPIRSIAIILGGINTPLFTANPRAHEEISKETLLKRMDIAKEVAQTVAYIIN